jgi:formylglycine-generating enzyme required for sulfatase activity
VEGGTFFNETSNVTVSSFYIDKYELTQSEYQNVMGSNPAIGFGVGDNFPVYLVSWYDAIEYCNKRSISEGLTPCYSYLTYGTNPNNWPIGWDSNHENHINIFCDWIANGYRLPTEAEWEFAFRGGNQSNNYIYSGSNTIEDVAWYAPNSGNSSHQVGTKQANELGIFNMSGNVWEWCWDIYSSYPNGSYHIVCGGGWNSAAIGCTVFYRDYDNATGSYNGRGFRICRKAMDNGEVDTPTYTPSGGNFDFGTNVEITCSTLGAEIYYTIDGSEPTRTSILYNAPIEVVNTTTIKAKAFKHYMAPSETVTETYTILSTNFVYVEGGTYFNGTSNVNVSSFYIDQYEITQSEYQDIMGSNPAIGYGVGENYPIYNISWYNAIEYCNRRSMNESLIPCYSFLTYGTNPDDWPIGWDTSNNHHTYVSCDWNANGYRVPTEAEWEFAARGGNLSNNCIYSGSNVIGDVAWYESNSNGATHPVGTKQANELNIFDMSGNICDWCWDIFGNYPSEIQTDPTGAETGTNRSIRGGSWWHFASNCSVSLRSYAFPTSGNYYIGIRLVRIASDSGVVDNPYFAPMGGTFDFGTTVEITCTTPGAEIYYTTDESEPTRTSIIYSSPIDLTNTTTIKAKAFKYYMMPSITVLDTYEIYIPYPSTFVFVEGGTFSVGTALVTVSSFYIDKYETTQGEYEEILGVNPAYDYGINNDNPAYYISWFKAIEYCNRRSINDGLTPCYSYSTYGTNPDYWPLGWDSSSTYHGMISCNWSNNGYRLPTEAEWEFAARGGIQSNGYNYCGSNSIENVAWYYSNSENTTHPVGTKQANELSINDMSGNVWEWCWDRYGIYPSSQTNPTGASSGDTRVLRGGSIGNNSTVCTAINRSSYMPGGSLGSVVIGFRVLRNAN